MGDVLKDKKGTKRLARDSTTSKKGTTPVSSMAQPAPVDQPTFDKLHVIQKDWAQREWIEAVNGSLKKIVDFLNKFGSFPYSTINLNNSKQTQFYEVYFKFF